jgi:HPt (histidine-containing phosphotransfer) domain-containing protein
VADKHLDPDVLSALQEVMEGEYPILVDTFLADSEQRLQLLKQAANATQFLETAHSFKGSSSNMGAIRLADLCHELELKAQGKIFQALRRLSRKSIANSRSFDRSMRRSDGVRSPPVDHSALVTAPFEQNWRDPCSNLPNCTYDPSAAETVSCPLPPIHFFRPPRRPRPSCRQFHGANR